MRNRMRRFYGVGMVARCVLPCAPALSSGGSSAGRGTRDIDDGHALFLVVPAVESLDAGNIDLVVPEKVRHMNGRGLVGLTDLRGAFFFSVERADADDLALLVVEQMR